MVPLSDQCGGCSHGYSTDYSERIRPGRTPAGIDLSAFEVPDGMVVSSITLSPAVTSEAEEEEPATDEEVEKARRSSSGRYPHGR
jgi:hypothetical protein